MPDPYRTARRRLHALGRDRVSGAAQLADRAAAILLAFLRRTPASAVNTAGQLARLAEALGRAQPAMAPVLKLAHLAATAAREKGLPAQAGLRELRGVLTGFRRDLRSAQQRIARRFAARLPRRAVVLTYSYSSTVLAALRAARPKLTCVICSEGQPMLEGRRLATELARAGIRVVLVGDAALPGRVQEADAVVVGADAVFLDPAGSGAGAYVNKIGTGVLQAAARAARKPFYVLADTSKILPRPLARKYCIEEKRAAELWRRAPRGVRVENRYFERVPFARGVVVLTERGPLATTGRRRPSRRRTVQTGKRRRL